MTNNLSSQKCESCAGLPPLSKEEVAEFMKDPELLGWTVEGEKSIAKTFTFQDKRTGNWYERFDFSADFAKGLLDLVKKEGHHPTYYTHDSSSAKGAWIKVVFSTHAIGGLSPNDFRMAAKLNTLYTEATHH